MQDAFKPVPDAADNTGMTPRHGYLCLWLLTFAIEGSLPNQAMASWPVDGLAVCTAPSWQNNPAIVAASSGGVIIAWEDNRTGNYDIYAQHVLSSGVVDPAWPADGLQVCTAADWQTDPGIVADSSGGVIIAWRHRGADGQWGIYSGHVLSSGMLDPAWPAGGLVVCTAAHDDVEPDGPSTPPRILTDGAGGMIVTWGDFLRGGAYTHHVMANGALDPAWPVGGRALGNGYDNLFIVGDGAGGAIVAWTVSVGALAQRVLATGALDTNWPAAGQYLAYDLGRAGSLMVSSIVTDGAGGAIVGWLHNLNASIGAQHILSNGVVDPVWPPDGRVVWDDEYQRGRPTAVADELGGVILVWPDLRTPPVFTSDIHAQRLMPSGVIVADHVEAQKTGRIAGVARGGGRVR